MLDADLQSVTSLTDEEFRSITKEECLQHVNNLSFLAVSLYRLPTEWIDDDWKEYMKRLAVYLHKRGIFRVIINSLRHKGILTKSENREELNCDQDAIEEVKAFDKLINPLMTYFGRYEGRHNYSLFPGRSFTDEEEQKDI
jgi:hypothetical protein